MRNYNNEQDPAFNLKENLGTHLNADLNDVFI